MAEILILSGPPAAGKSSVARALADRYDRVAHVEVDVLRGFVTPTGYIAPGKPGWERQQSLGVRNACALALNFLDERFAVIIDDVVPEVSLLQAYLEGLVSSPEPVHFVRLLPSLEVCLERNRQRREGRMNPERVESVWREFASANDVPGSVIDSSAMSVFETADRLQALTTSGESIVWRPEPEIEA